jgi:hypothetical protein
MGIGVRAAGGVAEAIIDFRMERAGMTWPCRHEQGFTFQLNLTGVWDEARPGFADGRSS